MIRKFVAASVIGVAMSMSMAGVASAGPNNPVDPPYEKHLGCWGKKELVKVKASWWESLIGPDYKYVPCIKRG